MQPNVGGFERVVRVAIGVALIVVGVAGYAGYLVVAIGPIPQALSAVVFALIGIILLITGVVQWCPINAVIGIIARPSNE